MGIKAMISRFASRFLVAGALAAVCGCGMSSTGEPWSTKSSSSVTSAEPLPVPALIEDTSQAEELRQASVELLQQASEASNALLRANAIEAMQHAPAHIEPLVRRGLVDDNHGVRFVAAMSVGEQNMVHLAHLLEPLLRDGFGSVQAAAIYGLHRCGSPVDRSPLASMIVSDDPEVRANAAMILGEMGNPSAAPMIRQAAGRGMELVSAARVKMVDLQLAEALVKLGDEREIEVIRAALFAPAEQGEITALACMMCGRLKDERAVPNLVRLARRGGQYRQPAEVRMAATWALARIDPAQAAMSVPLEYAASGQYQLRAQAALTLGEIGDPQALPTLAPMLQDSNPLVQVAAAGGILQITSSPRSAWNRPQY
jgi:HEAT repeat protein